MNKWKRVKIGDLITQYKNIEGISKNKEYKQVTVSKTGEIKLRGIKKGTGIKAKTGMLVEKQTFIYSRLAIHNGAFGIIPDELDKALVTNEMPVFKFDKSKIVPNFFLILLKTEDIQLQLQLLSRGVGRVRVKEERFLNIEVLIPDIVIQKAISQKNNILKEKHNLLLEQNSIQQSQLANLRQQILQDATSGKLTANWRAENPSIEPASKLLKQVKAEKEKLIKEKKIRKGKPLPEISDEEIPFELPEKWEWVRLIEIGDFFTGNSINKTIKKIKYTKIDKGYPYIGTKDVHFDGAGINYDSGVKIPFDEEKFKIAKSNTILICIEGGSSGKKYAITNKKICFGNKLLASTSIEPIDPFYIYNYYQSDCFKEQFNAKKKGLRGGVSVAKFKEILFPLPPLPEQKAIVKRVEKLMEYISHLEERINQDKKNAEILIQSFLNEVFKS